MSRHHGSSPPPAAGSFSDRIMEAVARESAPTPARTLLAAVRARSASDAASALWVAWHLGTVRRWRIAPSVRARSIALVLAAACALGTGSLATAAALRVAAQPVVELVQSRLAEHGRVENHPSGADQRGIVEANQPAAAQQGGGDDVDNGQSGVVDPKGDIQSGSDETREKDADNDRAGGDEAAGGRTDNIEAGTDEPSGQDVGNPSGANVQASANDGDPDPSVTDHASTDGAAQDDNADGDEGGDSGDSGDSSR